MGDIGVRVRPVLRGSQDLVVLELAQEQGPEEHDRRVQQDDLRRAIQVLHRSLSLLVRPAPAKVGRRQGRLLRFPPTGTRTPERHRRVGSSNSAIATEGAFAAHQLIFLAGAILPNPDAIVRGISVGLLHLKVVVSVGGAKPA